MFNGGVRGKRASDGAGFLSSREQFVQTVLPVPKITSWSVVDGGTFLPIDDTAAGVGTPVVIYGSGFTSGMSVTIGTTSVTSLFLDSTRILFTVPALSNGTYSILITSSTGAAILTPGITLSSFPTWTTGTYSTTDGATFSVQLLATGDAPLTYRLMAGSSLPSGITLSTSGVVSGTLVGVTDNSVYSFVVLVDDAQLQTSQQTITLNVFFSDTQFYNTVLLVNSEVPNIEPSFITDSSTNNSQLSVFGDTVPTKSSPYYNTNYSLHFINRYDYVSVPATTPLTTFTGDFTFECWVYPMDVTVTQWGIWDARQSGQSANAMIFMLSPLASPVTGQGRLLYYNGSYNYGTGTVYYNQWTHVAFVRVGSTMTFYINGVAGGTATISGTQTGTATTNPIYIGSKDPAAGAAYGTVGNISNLRIVNGNGIYTTNFTPSTTALTAIPSTVLLVGQSNKVVDNSLYNNTLTVSSPGTASGIVVSPASPLTIPADMTVNTGTSVYFNGSTDYISLPSNTAFSMGTGDFTIEAWVNTPTFTYTGTTGKIFSSSAAGGVTFEIESTGKLVVGRAGFSVLLTSTTGLALNTWQHVAVTRISGVIAVYINGVAAGSVSGDTTNFSQSTPIIGAESGPTRYFKGWLSNVRVVKGVGVYTAAFTPSTSPLTSDANTAVLTCQGNTIVDASANNFAITLAGLPKIYNTTYPLTPTTATTTSIATYGSTYFDGTGDYLLVPDNGTTLDVQASDFTIECWFYPTVTPNNNLFGKRPNTATYGGIAVGFSNSLAPLVLATVDGSSWGINSTSSVSCALNAWNHIALSRSGTTWKLFVNGIQGVSATLAGTVPDNASAVSIAAAAADGGLPITSCYISDFRVVKGTALYTTNFIPTLVPLTTIANTALLTCQFTGTRNNSQFKDNSKFNHPITKITNSNLGSFSPHIPVSWSVFMGGSGSCSYTDANAPNLNVYTLNPVTVDFSIEAWVNASGANDTNQRCIVSKGDFTTINCLYSIYLYNGFINARIGNYGSQFNMTSIVAFTPHAWHHVALVRTGSTFSLYYDGVRVATATNATNLPTSTADFSIGNYGSSYPFVGHISNVRLVKDTPPYNATLGSLTVPTSPLTVIPGTALLTCQSSRVIDNSPFCQIPTMTYVSAEYPIMVSYSPFGSIKEPVPNNYGVRFPANGAYLTGSNATFNISATTSVWTFECWVFPAASGGYFFGIGSGGAYGNSLALGYGSTTANKFSFNQGSGSGSNPVAVTSTNTYPLGSWYHYAVTRQGTGIMTQYINGVADGTVTYNAATVATGTTFIVNGLYDNNGLGNNGSSCTISNLRFLVGTALYTTNFTVPTTALSAITNTKLLICNSTSTTDLSGNNFPITIGGEPRVVKANPFGYTSQSTTNYSPTVHGGSVYFDGTGDYLRAGGPYNNHFKLGSDFTIEFWIYPKGSSSVDQPMFQLIGTQGSGSSGDWVFSLTSGQVAYSGYAQGAATFTTSTQRVQSYAWNHIAMVRTIANGTMKVYVNGVYVGSNTSYLTQVIGTGGLTIGAGASSFNGYFSDFRITQSAVYTTNFLPPTSPLTDYQSNQPSTILLNFNNGSLLDKRNITNLDSSTGVVRSTSIKKFGSASMYFNGSSYLTPYGDIVGTGNDMYIFRGDFTIECWVYLTASANHTVISFGQATNPAFRFYISSYPIMQDYSGSTTIYFSSQTVSLNTWTHIAWVRSGTTVTAYVNGVSAGTGTYSSTVGTGVASSTMQIGTDWSRTGMFLTGYLDDLRVTRGFARYVANFSVPTTPFPAQ